MLRLNKAAPLCYLTEVFYAQIVWLIRQRRHDCQMKLILHVLFDPRQ